MSVYLESLLPLFYTGFVLGHWCITRKASGGVVPKSGISFPFCFHDEESEIAILSSFLMELFT